MKIYRLYERKQYTRFVYEECASYGEEPPALNEFADPPLNASVEAIRMLECRCVALFMPDFLSE